VLAFLEKTKGDAVEPEAREGAPVRVLVVDDDDVFLMTTTSRLMLNGLDVHAFTDPREALLVADRMKFDIALVDLKMPDMTGDEVTQELKKKDATLETIVLSAHGSIAVAGESLCSGAFLFLNKPCETEELLWVIATAFAKRLKMTQPGKAARVENLLSDPRAYSSIELLHALERLAAE
jgi:DNA-binding NtrC family response regulator